jgi:hypothetical protein
MAISTQLIVGLSNGHVYQFDLLNLMKPQHQQTEPSVKLQPAVSVLETHIIDLKGNSQIAIHTELKEPPEVPVKSPLSRTPTTKTKSSTSSSQGNSPESSTDELNTRQRAASVSSVGSNSKRMVAIGKSDYRQQENPHFIIYTCPTAVQIVLAGFNVKLFNRVFKDIQIIKTQVVQSFGKGSMLFKEAGLIWVSFCR